MLNPYLRGQFGKSVIMGLAAAAGGLILMLGQSLMAHRNLGKDMSDSDQMVMQNNVPGRGSELPNRQKRAVLDLAQFQIVLDRDPFHSPYETLATVPVKAVPPPPALSQQPAVLTPKPPLPPLSVTLLGTIVIGESRKAILKDGKQEDIYSVGQAVGGGLLVTVEDDQVVIARGDEQTPLRLKSALDSGMLPVAALPASGAGQSEKLATKNKNQKAGMAVRPVVATPAMARYPQFVR